MKKFIELLNDEMMDAFEKAGYDRALGRVGQQQTGSV